MSDEIPFLAIGNEEVEGRPTAKVGDRIRCPTCQAEHPLIAFGNADRSNGLLIYRCGEDDYLACVGGRLLPDVELVR